MSLKNVLTIPFIVAVFSITIVIVFENMGILYGQMEAIGKKLKSLKAHLKLQVYQI